MWFDSDEETLAGYLKSEDAAVAARTLLKEESRKAYKRGDKVIGEALRLGATKQTESLSWLRRNIRRLRAAKAEHDSRYSIFDEFDNACRFLGLQPPFGTDDYKAAYRRMARQTHPDHGGTTEQFLAFTRACEVILSHSSSLRRNLVKQQA